MKRVDKSAVGPLLGLISRTPRRCKWLYMKVDGVGLTACAVVSRQTTGTYDPIKQTVIVPAR